MHISVCKVTVCGLNNQFDSCAGRVSSCCHHIHSGALISNGYEGLIPWW
jgi:hypothetical protein